MEEPKTAALSEDRVTSTLNSLPGIQDPGLEDVGRFLIKKALQRAGGAVPALAAVWAVGGRAGPAVSGGRLVECPLC